MSSKEAEIRKYLEEKVDPFLKPLLLDLMKNKPANVYDYLRSWVDGKGKTIYENIHKKEEVEQSHHYDNLKKSVASDPHLGEHAVQESKPLDAGADAQHHKHPDGTEHSHEGGDKPHHHHADGTHHDHEGGDKEHHHHADGTHHDHKGGDKEHHHHQDGAQHHHEGGDKEHHHHEDGAQHHHEGGDKPHDHAESKNPSISNLAEHNQAHPDAEKKQSQSQLQANEHPEKKESQAEIHKSSHATAEQLKNSTAQKLPEEEKPAEHHDAAQPAPEQPASGDAAPQPLEPAKPEEPKPAE